jgi:hypothetical protein
MAQMGNRHAAPLRRFLAGLDDAQAESFIDQLTTLIAHLRDDPTPGNDGTGARGAPA